MDLSKAGSGGHPKASCQWRQMRHEELVAFVQAEISQMKQLPAVSAYAKHRLRVLNTVLQLLTQVRNPAENEELELLFAGLSI